MSLRTDAKDQGLTSEEFDRIVSTIGREPNRVELGIFAVMWSEHCCYKSSKIHLKALPTRGSRVVQGPGENAGIIDIGDGLVLAFKIESHNHPSFIEPFQGAATGVGGILRDIFTMGARPVAILDSLHFGEPTHPKTPFLYHGVIGGIGGYGNCMGIPTVGGETIFDRSYNGNNLVNAMALGVAKKEMLHKAIAKGAGNRVLYLGSKTGRDGIHGATMASQDFGAGNEERRPTVQVGDPFTEKLLMEASLQLMEEKLLIGIQDMGAAGVACSTFEMSARGKCGMDINVDHVPLRDPTLGAYEIFLSESQERMLFVAEEEKLPRIFEIAKKWDVDCVDVGVVTNTGRVVAKFKGEVVVDLPVLPVTDEAPLYDRPSALLTPSQVSIPGEELSNLSFQTTVEKMISSPNLSSRKPLFSQYDHTVGADSVVIPGGDAAVLRVKGTKQGIAAVVDSNSRYCAADPYLGMLHVVAECVRNLACVGAKAVATTNCLNFGNPEIPEVMAQLKHSIRALGDSCITFETPITGGNVSLYNQTGEVSIKPTPTIGMIGLIEDANLAISSSFRKEGDEIILLGPVGDGKIYQSEFARTILEREDLACPPIDLKDELVLQKALIQLIQERLLHSAHDCSDGGLIQTLLESCNEETGLGFEVSSPKVLAEVAFWFGEYPGRAVASFPSKNKERIETILKNHGLTFRSLGQVVKEHCKIENQFTMKVLELKSKREEFLQRL